MTINELRTILDQVFITHGNISIRIADRTDPRILYPVKRVELETVMEKRVDLETVRSVRKAVVIET